jgi:MoaA/NifB/PqqE/SkfB family radical SAM enzyme
MINDQNKHSWCVNADHAMSANNNGTTKICCMIRNEEEMAVGSNTIQENFNKSEFIDIRNALQNGDRHRSCSWCWQEEDSGRKSKRLRDNEKYLSHLSAGGEPFNNLAKFELNLGNTCNLKCRTCAPHSSSQWMKEYFDVYESKKYQNDYKKYSIQMKKYHQTYDDESPFWDDLIENLPTIKQFDFYGGEPFMSKKMWSVLELAVDKGYAKEIELHYATNGTQWPKERIDIFNHFRHLNLNFSIDGVGKQFEYMRYPASWEEAQQNMEYAREFKKTHHNMQLSWCSTLSTLNIYSLPELLDEFYKTYVDDFGIYLNLVHGPIHFNISKIHPDIRLKVIERLESIPKEYQTIWWHYLPGIINFINGGTFDLKIWGQFKNAVSKHDDYRNQNYAEVFPDFAEILGK